MLALPRYFSFRKIVAVVAEETAFFLAVMADDNQVTKGDDAKLQS
jgi:hypothetical protein